jgi:hydrogenase maturation protein HypF
VARLLASGTAPVTTAAGRLFDAAAGLLGVSSRAAFEGEPPMLLEGLVRRPAVWPDGYTLRDGVLDFGPLLGRLADCGEPAEGADLLHGTMIHALVAWAEDAARRSGIETVVLAGGCLLNVHLARAVPPALAARGLQVLTARAMPPNDGAISLGQAWVARWCQ